MAKVQIILPAMGEGIIEAEITRWLVKEGQAVEAEDPVVEIATDKVDSEIPSPASGIILKILVGEGEIPKVGQVLAIISADGDDEIPEEITEAPPPLPVKEETPEPYIQMHDHSSSLADVAFLSPVVRKLARDHRVRPTEILKIKGSGVGGRITRKDLEDYLAERSGKSVGSDASGDTVESGADPEISHPEEIPYIPDEPSAGDQNPGDVRTMDRMRKRIADHMVHSKKTAPHVTSFIESDVTEMMTWRNQVREDFKTKYGQNLTVTTLIIEAVVKALKEFPDINVSVDGDRIIYKKDLNLGMAAALPDGNLIVPVIRQADKLNLAGLASKVNDLAERARTNRLKPEEVTGGTFTITNLGNFGNIAGTPIINQPEVAILAVGAIRKMPAVVETPEGDAIGIRQMMILSLAYDHRVVDGALGGSFLQRIGHYLQNFDSIRSI